jgi:hypothetical protein
MTIHPQAIISISFACSVSMFEICKPPHTGRRLIITTHQSRTPPRTPRPQLRRLRKHANRILRPIRNRERSLRNMLSQRMLPAPISRRYQDVKLFALGDTNDRGEFVAVREAGANEGVAADQYGAESRRYGDSVRQSEASPVVGVCVVDLVGINGRRNRLGSQEVWFRQDG